MAEDLSSFLLTRGIKSQYIHSDLGTLERIEILKKLRQGVLDCVVGVNLLREGLDKGFNFRCGQRRIFKKQNLNNSDCRSCCKKS